MKSLPSVMPAFPAGPVWSSRRAFSSPVGRSSVPPFDRSDYPHSAQACSGTWGCAVNREPPDKATQSACGPGDEELPQTGHGLIEHFVPLAEGEARVMAGCV